MVNLREVSVGARNLLINCAQLKIGEKLLIVSEDSTLGWYKDDITRALVKECIDIGVEAKIIKVGEPENTEIEGLNDLVEDFDCTLFLARVGDQKRFETPSIRRKRVMCYARSVKTLGSSFGTTDHRALMDMKKAIDNIFLNSKYISISCPNGSELSGTMLTAEHDINKDVTVLRFPMAVPMPIVASTFSGNVLIQKYLTSTGSKVYKPNYLKLSDPLSVKINKGRITAIDGQEQVKRNFQSHYEFVSNLFNLDKNCVHSWHAGIHPGITYNQPISENPDRWANTMFASPQFMHFHTCGSYPPGEICWMIENPTIEIDAEPLWKRGKLQVNNFDLTKNCLDQWSELRALYN